MTEPTGKNGVKTLGIKLPPGLHAQFALVAQLDGIPLTIAVQRAVEHYVETKQSEDDFAARAQEALDEIEREATSRRDAIQALFGQQAQAEAPSVGEEATNADVAAPGVVADADTAAEGQTPKASRSRRK